jgi:diguanylate cyclase (GGDEF)-like protein
MTINRPFADCETADLHLANAIQSFGAMVVVDADDTIVAVSANSEPFFGASPQDLLGTDARCSLPAALDLDAARALADEPARGGPLRLSLRQIEVAGRDLTVAVHARDGHVIVETQAPDVEDMTAGEAAGVVQRMTDDLEGATTPEDAARLMLDAVARLAGFDRAMLYRFLPGWHGEVVDERLAAGVSGYLGLRFPAGDIPANARRLYTVKRQRIIADVGASTVPVLGVREGMSLDLSGSELRAVHPVHLEYLENMGVSASFSVSIVAKGRLWGMVACHHFASRTLGFVRRQACETVAAIASLQIANVERIAHLDRMSEHRVVRAWARAQVESDGEVRLPVILPRLREAFGADGALAGLEGARYVDGDVPEGASADRLRALCARWPRDAVTAGSEVPSELADDAEVVRAASGILHLPLGDDAFVTLLRREQAETVTWAGRPPTDAELASDGKPLGPRTSFAMWREAVRGHASPWSAADVESAEALRTMLLEQLERAELEEMARTDELTGLANRVAFDASLREALSDGGWRRTAVLMLDLDGFKQVNDTYGHPVGDRLLEHVADRLRGTLRQGDVAARLGGDEFAVVLRDAPDEPSLAGAASRVVAALGEAMAVDGRSLVVTASVGAALARGPDDTADALTERADRALYAAKGGGRNRYVVAGPDEDEGSGEKVASADR